MSIFSTKGIAEKTWASNSKPVRCIQTQEIFESGKAAAEWAGVNSVGIHLAVKKGIKAAGYNWEFVV